MASAKQQALTSCVNVPLWSSVGAEVLRTCGKHVPMSRSARVNSFMKYGN